MISIDSGTFAGNADGRRAAVERAEGTVVIEEPGHGFIAHRGRGG